MWDIFKDLHMWHHINYSHRRLLSEAQQVVAEYEAWQHGGIMEQITHTQQEHVAVVA